MRKRVPLLIGMAAVLVLAAIAARGPSAIDFGSRPSVTVGPRPVQTGSFSKGPSTLPPSVQPNGIVGAGIAVVLVLILVGVVLALIAVGVLISRYGRRGAHSARTPVRAETGAAAELVDDDRMRRGADYALTELRRAGTEPADAIQSAWLRLEEAAESGGTARKPHETSTEFTVSLLRARRVEAEPLAVLRGLYQRTRFGDPVAVTDTDVAAAIAATERIVGQLRGDGDG